MNSLNPLVIATAVAVASFASSAASNPGDRVYTADPNIDTLLGQIKLGNQRPDVLSPH